MVFLPGHKLGESKKRAAFCRMGSFLGLWGSNDDADEEAFENVEIFLPYLLCVGIRGRDTCKLII